MISEGEWRSLLYLSQGDFGHPDQMQWDVVKGLDTLIGWIGSRPLILSDWRPYDPVNPNSQHANGTAIDTTWPGVDPLVVWSAALDSGLFTGAGVYVNESGVASFHFDSRPPKADGTVAQWGGVISHPIDGTTGQPVRQTEYTTADVVLDILKKKGAALITSLIVCGLIAWRILVH